MRILQDLNLLCNWHFLFGNLPSGVLKKNTNQKKTKKQNTQASEIIIKKMVISIVYVLFSCMCL